MLALIAAAAFSLGPRALALRLDDFTVVESHKVFAYGFPFRIAESSAEEFRTPSPQIALRLAGNFLFWFLGGLCAFGLAQNKTEDEPAESRRLPI